jgi:hypothetical protein
LQVKLTKNPVDALVINLYRKYIYEKGKNVSLPDCEKLTIPLNTTAWEKDPGLHFFHTTQIPNRIPGVIIAEKLWE